jgi:hypothetical protein
VKRRRLKGRYGDCDLARSQIQLLSSVDPVIQAQTFCHELGHAISFAMGIDAENHNEQNIDAWATFLHQFMTTAEYEEDS